MQPLPAAVSLRAVISGVLLAVLLCAVNSYLTLSFGVIEEGPTIAALFFFTFFFLSTRKITSTEMVMVATMGSAGGSLGFISNFFAARVMVGEPMMFWEMVSFSTVTSLLGMCFVIPLRELLIVREQLPWPGSRATEGVIRALVEDGDPQQPKILLVTVAVAMAAVLLNNDGGFGLLPAETHLNILGLGAYGAAIAWAPFAIGGAYFMGWRTCVGFLVGGLLLFGFAPFAENPALPQRYVWPGIGFLVASGLTGLALQGRVVLSALTSILKLGGGGDADADAVLSPRAFKILLAVAVLVTGAYATLGLDLNVLVVLGLIIVGGLVQNVIATRAAAQTAFNPARVMGILLQGVSAAAGAPTAGANLIGAGVVAGSGAQAGNLTGDMAYGQWFNVPARWQFWGQALTILPCALVSAWVFEQVRATSGLSLDGEGLAAPVAKMWAASSLVFAGKSPMPTTAMPHLIGGAVAGILWVLAESRPSIERWLPASTGVGLGLVLAPSLDFGFFIGGVLFFGILSRGLKIREITLSTVAVGCIVAEGFGGILKPVLVMLGLL
ncbi:OPT/YSL family transporter [Myxococcota bacterium]|nr:OPT/YSL family transporter [Myxococcota bacterium]